MTQKSLDNVSHVTCQCQVIFLPPCIC